MTKAVRKKAHGRWLLPLVVSSTVLFSGCTVGPNYHRPATGVPAVFRSIAPTLKPPKAATRSLGQTAWPRVFRDPVLQSLLRTAMAHNQDLSVAAARVEEARQSYRLSQLKTYPLVNGQANFTDQRLSQRGLPAEKVDGNPEGSAGIGSLSMTWAFDFWGHYRRMREAARARLLATEAAGNAVHISLVAAVATAYYQLREYDAELKASTESLKLRRNSLALTAAREKGGVASLLDVRQAQTLVTEAEQSILTLRQLIPQDENRIHLLLGGYPGKVKRGLTLAQQHIPDLPAGLPSKLLERRPDIQESEEQLHAASADIGVVRSDYFPNIGLTSSVGTESAALTNLLTGGATNWLIVPELNVPIFTAGRIHARERKAKAAEQAALHHYQATVRKAFEEVSNALIARTESRQFRLRQQHQVEITGDAAQLSNARYKGGVTNYLEVLTSQRTSLAARLSLAQAKFNELEAGVRLYAALGGGWRH